MAIIVAQANGNFSAAGTWAGGVVPGAGDVAQTGNYTVTIDASVECTLNPTGSGYFKVTSGGITITGDLVMQSSYTGGGLRCEHNSGTVALTGTATGGAGSYTYGASNNGVGTLTVGTATGGAGNNAHGALNYAAGTMTVGTATGGAGQYAYGAYNNAAGTMTVGTATGGARNNVYGAYNNAAGTLTVGTATGGAGQYAHGAYNNAAGTMSVGTATGGAGSGSHGAYNAAEGTMTVDLAIGNNWGVGGSGGYAYGVYGNGVAGQTTRVKRTQSGPYGAPAIGGAVLMVADATNSAQFRTAYGGATKTLTDPNASADWPAVSDVRHGTQYDNGDRVGTAHIPAPGQVALGIPVDATTGTAVLTAAAVAAGVDKPAIAAAVLAAAAETPISAALAATQGAVTFGQVKILADVNGEGALHVENSNVGGFGQYNNGGNAGQANMSSNAGQINSGDFIGQLNFSYNIAQFNDAPTPVVGAASQEIADALLLAPAAGAPAAGSVYALLADVSVDPQAVRDAMLLAPTPPGTAAAGSVDAHLDALLAYGAGAGAIAFTYTLTNAVGGAAIPDAEVWVTSDVDGTTLLASGRTDARGQVTFYLDAGTVYVWRRKSGWNFTNPDTETVA